VDNMSRSSKATTDDLGLNRDQVWYHSTELHPSEHEYSRNKWIT
jgi:hypothetical protein